MIEPLAIARTRLPAWQSLRWRLPFLIVTLITTVVATFLAVAYREVRADHEHAAAARAQSLAEQLAGLFAQSSRQRLSDVRRVASDESLRRLLDQPTDDTRAQARVALGRLVLPGPQRIEVWNVVGERVLVVVSPPTAAALMPAGSVPVAAGIGPFQSRGSDVVGEVTVDIGRATTPERAPEDPRLGWLVVIRPVGVAPTGDTLSRLVGGGATIAVGNTAGDIWTDLSRRVDPPQIDLTHTGIATAQDRSGRHIGSLARIAGTPWSIWIAFPENLILAPARAFLGRMLLMAFGFVILAAAVIAIVTSRITTPLHTLTRAAEAIAAGEYSRRVPVDRRDEVGRLGATFNAMTAQVEQAHHELEDRVRQRTANLEEAAQLLERRLHDIKEAREELGHFFALSLDLLCIANFEGRFTRVNPAWEGVLGWSAEELTTTPYLDFVHVEDRAATVRESGRLVTGRATVNFENRFRHKDGTYRWFSWKAVSDPERGVIYAAARDVTADRQAADALQQQAEELGRHAAELAAVNHELEAFSYSVSHDLRAPLRHISGFAMILEQSAASALDATSRRHLATISRAATRMGRLIDDLLSFSRIGRTQLTRSRVDLNQVGHDARAEVAADSNGRIVDWRLGPLPIVDGDPALLRLVLVNLLSNALKYSATRPRAEIAVGAIDGDAETIIFVRDNGVGFDMQYVDKLFGVFQRLHSSDDFEGTGIGLANVRRIVQRHGGRTWAEASIDGGATFYFSLPTGSVRDDRTPADLVS